MFILIFGKDAYRGWQKFKEIIEDFKEKNSVKLSLDFLDFQRLAYEDFKNELKHNSIFNENKIIAQRNAFSDNNFKEHFLKDRENFSDNTKNLVVFYEDKETFSTKELLDFFQRNGKFYKFDFLTGAKLKTWTQNEFHELKAKINPVALSLLISFVGSDLWRMSAEIRKLVAYKQKNKIIEKEDVELLVKPKIEAAIFNTIDAIANKDKKTALSLLYKHIEKGDSPFYLLKMIIFQFRNLLIVKELGEKSITEITTALKPMHPFVVRKSYYMAKKFKLKQLEKIYLKIFQIDLAMKTGKIKPEMALELLIADI
jgi:DNA polymerase-3 subunit delta